jgi:hypothetical protein
MQHTPLFLENLDKMFKDLGFGIKAFRMKMI